jgi:hypothetical protein
MVYRNNWITAMSAEERSTLGRKAGVASGQSKRGERPTAAEQKAILRAARRREQIAQWLAEEAEPNSNLKEKGRTTKANPEQLSQPRKGMKRSDAKHSSV